MFGRRLQTLDLSNNFLGYSDEGQTLLPGQAGWCGTAGSSGWCSANPLPGTMANLVTLDLSFNDLTGGASFAAVQDRTAAASSPLRCTALRGAELHCAALLLGQ